MTRRQRNAPRRTPPGWRTVALVLSLLLAARPQLAQPPASSSRTASLDAQVDSLLRRMTRMEKFRQIFMAPASATELAALDLSSGLFGTQTRIGDARPTRDAARAHARLLDSLQRVIVQANRHGIPPLFFEEVLHGLLDAGATVFPQAIGLAATFDTALVQRVHAAAARETRSRGIRMALSPVVNLATDPRWGRTEETFGEDPWLSAAMGRAHVRAFEGMGIVTTPKHFVANVSDGGRDSWPVQLSERTLEERFFPPFRSVLGEAGAGSLMTGYNSLNGDPVTQNRFLLHTTLRERWGFGGFVISDASATSGATVLHRTERNTAEAFRHALESGLDVVFQGGLRDIAPYERAVADGFIADSLLDRAAGRVLRAKLALGLFANVPINPDSAAYWNGHPEHLALAREAAAASLVLLHNTAPRGSADSAPPGRFTGAPSGGGALLPLAPSVRRLAVIGADAGLPRLGGYSGTGIAPVPIRAALAARPGVTVRYARGPGRDGDSLRVVPAAAFSSAAGTGLEARYWDNPDMQGEPTVQRTDAQLDFTWTLSSPARGIPYDWYSAEWTGTLEVPAGGVQTLAVQGNDGVRVWVNQKLVIDRWSKETSGRWVAPVRLPPGRHAIRIAYHERRGNAKLALLWDAGVSREVASQRLESRLAEAVAAARASEVAVVVVGVEEGEFRDRSRLSLPGHQDALVQAVAATGVPTVVIVVGGSAITMPWLDAVHAVLMAWYPGEQGGPAIADVLFGDLSPSGRLPISWPDREGQLPFTYDHLPTGRGDDYLDGSGAPRYPFGHGLSYSTFRWDSLVVRVEDERAGPTARVRVSARIQNVGDRVASEVVQLYLRDEVTSVSQPLIRLRRAARVHLAPGEAQRVEFALDASDLALLDRDMAWTVEPGRFRIMLGASSRDIRLRDTFILP